MFLPCVVIATLGAYLIAHRERKEYSATASLLFQTPEFSQLLFGYGTSQAASNPTVTQATDVTLSSEPAIGTDVSRALALPDSRVTSGVAIKAVGESNVVNVVATFASPSFATRVANTYAREVVAYQVESARAQTDAAASSLSRQITRLPPRAPERPALATRLSQLEAIAALETGGVQVADTATTPRAPSSPDVHKDVALGFIIGLLLAIAAVYAAERLDTRLRDEEDATRALGIPVLGMIPTTRSLSRGRPTDSQPSFEFREAFHLLRAQLRYFNVDRPLRSLLVTSAGIGDGKSTVAWNLARAAVETDPDSPVLLIDADLRRPSIAAMIDSSTTKGLADVLSGSVPLADAIQSVDVELITGSGISATMDVLTAGPTPPNPAQLLESTRFQDLLERLENTYSLVVIDSPPSAVVSDPIPLLRLVSGVLVVVRVNHSHRDALRVLRNQFSGLGVAALGIVVNGLASAATPYANHYYSPAAHREGEPAERTA